MWRILGVGPLQSPKGRFRTSGSLEKYPCRCRSCWLQRPFYFFEAWCDQVKFVFLIKDQILSSLCVGFPSTRSEHLEGSCFPCKCSSKRSEALRSGRSYCLSHFESVPGPSIKRLSLSQDKKNREMQGPIAAKRSRHAAHIWQRVAQNIGIHPFPE